MIRIEKHTLLTDRTGDTTDDLLVSHSDKE